MNSQVLTLLGVALLLATFRTVATRRLEDYISGYTWQSLALAAIAAAAGIVTGVPDLFVVAAATLLVKAWLIPRVLRDVAARLTVGRGERPVVGPPASVLSALILVALAFFASPQAAGAGTLAQPPLAVAVGIVLIGLFLLATRRHVVAQLVGLLTVENGLFCGAVAIAYGLPLIVEFGILFDILILVIVIGLLVGLIQRELASTDTAELRRLRG